MTQKFAVLGPLTVANSAGALDLGSPKQKAVLALLLINANQPLSSEQIIDGLWGENPPESAMATLQAYISNLRRALEPERPARTPAKVIAKNGGGYQLVTPPNDLDSLRFETLVVEAGNLIDTAPVRARDLFAEALDIWRGPAYADFRYEDFAQAEIARLDELRLMAVEQRLEAELAMGYAEELIAELESLVGDHPLRERLWRHLMLALYRSGRQAEALRAYRRCEEILADELGIVPSEGLRDLEFAVLNQDPALNQPARPSAQSIPSDRRAPIVGREYERDRVRTALDAAAQGHGSMILFEGEPGVGKTRLFESLQSEAREFGFDTMFARCVEIGGTPPFWPWIQVMRQLGSDRVVAAAQEYANYLAPLLPGGHEAAPGAPLFRVAEALAAALRVICANSPLLILIDDLYSADPDSLSVLTLLGAELADIPIVVVGSHRGERLDSGSPLADTITQLMRLDWVQRITMRRLQIEEVGELVRQIADADVAPETVAAINDRTEGNAFFTVQLTKLLESEHCLSAEKAATAVPSSLLEVMGRRLNRLSEQTVRLITAGAVYGREFDVAIVAEALDLDLGSAVDLLEPAVRSELIAETDNPGTYRFTHMIAVGTITHSLGAIRRAHIHTLVADALEHRYGDEPTRWIEIAHHRTEAAPASGTLLAVDALARAGNYALESTALELAEELFLKRHALVIDESPSSLRDQMETAALFDLARIWTWREGYHSDRLYEAVKRLWTLTGIEQGKATFAEGQPITAVDTILSTFQARFSYEIVSGSIGAAAEVVDQYLALSQQFPDPMVEFSANLSALVVRVHLPAVAEALEAAEKAERALEVLDPKHEGHVGLPLNQQSGRVTYHVFSGWAFWLAGQRERSLEEFAEARRLSEKLEHPFNRAFTVCVEGLIGAMERSPEWVAELVAWGRAGPGLEEFELVDTWIQLLDCWSSGMLGSRPLAAAKEFREILAYTEASGARVIHTLYMGMVAELELKAGRFEDALVSAHRGIELSNNGERFWYPELERLAAQAHGALGNSKLRNEALRRSEAAAREYGIVPLIERLAATSTSG